ncbi:hypothetical protein EJB05_04684, partial [Eragrostis curvula]
MQAGRGGVLDLPLANKLEMMEMNILFFEGRDEYLFDTWFGKKHDERSAATSLADKMIESLKFHAVLGSGPENIVSESRVHLI